MREIDELREKARENALSYHLAGDIERTTYLQHPNEYDGIHDAPLKLTAIADELEKEGM